MYIPGDALNTSYKSDYESVALGQMLGQGAEALKIAEGKKDLI